MIRYRTTPDGLREEQLSGFFVGWPNPPAPATHLRVLEGSDHVALALNEDERVIGFATAITDGVLTAYVPLLEVLPDYRGEGVGRELVRRLLGQIGRLYSISLHCDPELEGFYESLGLRRLGGMAVRNFDAQAGRSH